MTVEPFVPCVPCTKRGSKRLATHTLELLDGSEMPVCDVCMEAFPLPARYRTHELTALPWADEARRQNHIDQRKESLYGSSNR